MVGSHHQSMTWACTKVHAWGQHLPLGWRSVSSVRSTESMSVTTCVVTCRDLLVCSCRVWVCLEFIHTKHNQPDCHFSHVLVYRESTERTEGCVYGKMDLQRLLALPGYSCRRTSSPFKKLRVAHQPRNCETKPSAQNARNSLRN